MKTNDTICKVIKGNNYNVDEVIPHVLISLENVSVCNELFSYNENRVSYISDTYVGCSEVNLKNKNETAFSRALYNQRFLPLNGSLSVILDYEVALSGDNRQKVDLLAYNFVENKLIAIEYKSNPSNKDTGVEYGLVEAYIYGYLLRKYIQKNIRSIKKEICKKLEDLNLSYLKRIILEEQVKSEFILSAPVSYFLEFTKDNRKDAKRRLERIISLEKILRNNNSNKEIQPVFGGYFPISEISNKHPCIIRENERNITFPYIMKSIHRFEDLKDMVTKI